MGRLKMLPNRVATLDMRRVKPADKQAAPIYSSPEFREWREHVIANAGRRCQKVSDDGRRCTKAEPRHRMFADHIVELEDGGAPFDPANGQCLCGSHHTAKTIAARKARHARRGEARW